MVASLVTALMACSPPDEAAKTTPEAPAQTQVVARDGEKPTLLLVSSLPILFGPGLPSGAEFSIEKVQDGSESVLRAALEERFALLGIAATGPEELAQGELLLMAHPRAQTAEHLVALDEWVRGGGRVLLLADPAFAVDGGPPTLGGDYPPPYFADTGLLGHWGVLLDGPLSYGAAELELAGETVTVRSPGRFEAVGENCTLGADGFVADCALGDGRALILADADFVIEKGEPGAANLAALKRLLEQLAG